ncbi:MaoC family dehydratase [Pseudonocardia oroxyli]|uniref:Acyl dehydratase n=1 Tax=Pseudonocardia oroxyli TaxID=366584 RepID=A0A1G8EJ67_PSEOR|nr:MaoC family dehydratase [Pseudonocardia oroxyli]SDH69983.1 Acyl dehydratase [Pseudonocardia oroxyli]
MALDLTMAESVSGRTTVSWDPGRAILYALAVGAGGEDPETELEFTTDNTVGLEQAVLPTFPLALETETNVPWSGMKAGSLLHAGRSLTVHSEIPPKGEAVVKSGVGKIYDKGNSALVEMWHTMSDTSGRLLAVIEAQVLLRDQGGFGGGRGVTDRWQLPDRKPDAVVEQATMPWQALLYRLSNGHQGHLSPLHTDPEYASQIGFKRPPVQGDCTFGFAGRALLQTVLGGDPSMFGSMAARFVEPVIPGDVLRTSIWDEGEQILFVTRTGKDVLVLDRGVAARRSQS